MSDEQRMAGDSGPGNIYRPAIGDERQVHGVAVVAGSPIPQVKHQKTSMTVHELANAQRQFSNYSRFRLQMQGGEYDHGDKQGFESMTPHRLIIELRDELADAVNYLAFLDVQLSRWQRTMEDIP